MSVIQFLATDHPVFYAAYAALWIAFCLLALGFAVLERKAIGPEGHRYLHFLCVPWKLALFIPAFLFVTFAGRFTDDETWDVISGAGMSILTFVTAPYAIGLFYKVWKNARPPRYFIIALALCLFSSSWFYDAYIYMRDGIYSSRWLGNLIVSSIIYIAAGFLWNLEAKNKNGFTFSFLKSNWPTTPDNRSFRPFIVVVILLLLIAIIGLIAFVGWRL